MKKMLKKRAGFTLVELLIVIIIIGILAGAMLLVAGSGTDKAEATKIVSNLRSLKSASLLYYADHAGAGIVAMPNVASLEPYMDRTNAALTAAGYAMESSGDTVWFSKFAPTAIPAGIQGKLKDISAASGLYSTMTGTTYQSGNTVYMRAR